MAFPKKFATLLIFSLLCMVGFAQDQHNHADHKDHKHQTEENSAAHGHDAHGGHQAGDAHNPCGHHEAEFNAGDNAVHHIADANAIHVYGDIYFHLPVFLYAPSHGWTTTTTAAFKPHHHGNGTVAVDGYVLGHGEVMRVQDEAFPKTETPVECIFHKKETNEKGKEVEIPYVMMGGNEYRLDKKSTWDGGLTGGGVTSYYDLSITRNVFTMLLTCVLLFFMFRGVANSYAKRDGQAPKGLQSFLEPIIGFVRDEVAAPIIGPKYERYLPYLLTVFFFILGLNLIGQIPFFPGSANVTGSLSVTAVLAIITFIITNVSGNAHYWGHTLWMPGVPAVLKILIITPIEILGLFLKPFTLMLRLFANITAGHIVILSFVSLIFIFGKAGQSVSGSAVGAAASIPLTLFMMSLELLVAFLQAFIFTLLSAVYIGSAVEEAHH